MNASDHSFAKSILIPRLVPMLLWCLFGLVHLEAMPADPRPFDFTQPDGSKVTLRLRGDEFFHWHEDLEGFTVVRNGEPVQFLVRGDSRGRLLVDNADQGGEHHHHHDHHHGHHHGHHDHGHHEHGDHGDRGYAVQSAQLEGGQMMAMMALAATDDPASPDFMAGGDPPPKQPPPPGFTAAGGVMLGTAFDVAENLPTNGAPPK